MSRVPWNDMTILEYRELKKNYTDTEIARKKFISMPTLSRWKKRNEVRATLNLTDIRALQDKGYTQEQIGIRMNRSQSAISQQIRRKRRNETIS
jgi:hypothetical protein